jgi:hypothetical protein
MKKSINTIIFLLAAIILIVFFTVTYASSITYTISNAGTVANILPLSDSQTASEYYAYGGWNVNPYGDSAFGSENNTGFFWIYEDYRNGNISLGMIFDEINDKKLNVDSHWRVIRPPIQDNLNSINNHNRKEKAL